MVTRLCKVSQNLCFHEIVSADKPVIVFCTPQTFWKIIGHSKNLSYLPIAHPMKTTSIVVLLASSVLLTGISAVITRYAVQDSRDRVNWVFHTYEVINRASDILSTLKNIESNQRRYMLTGSVGPLKDIEAGHRTLLQLIDSLQHKVADNPQQTWLLKKKLVPAITRKLDHIYTVSTIYKHSTKNDALFLKEQNEEKALTDSIETWQALFIEHEKNLLTDRLLQVATTHKRQNVIRYTSFSLIALASVLALITILQKEKKNTQLISAMNNVNETLEKKVKQRTYELQKQFNVTEELNEELQQNMEELESFYEALQIRNIKAEDALAEVQDLYNNAPCGYHSLAPDGTILRMNETELNWLGYTSEEVLGKMHVTAILVPDEHQSYYNDFNSFKEHGFIHNKEHTFLRKDGSTFPILLNATAIYDEQGEYVMSRGTVIDISERKEAEEQLREFNKKLMHFNEEKNNFLAVAAHDLKSPINNIIGLTSLINMSKQDLPGDIQEYIRHIQRSCSNMQSLIINLLDINKIEQGSMELKPELINISSFMRQHIHGFREHSTAKNITLTLEDHQAVNTFITTDLSALQRILDNLLSNAIKFSPKNKNVTLRVQQDLAMLRIEVEDQGPGIPPEEIGLLFRKFKRLSARPTDGESSTGLGLSIVKQLVQVLKGKISVESKVGKGTTFVVELPLIYIESDRVPQPVI